MTSNVVEGQVRKRYHFKQTIELFNLNIDKVIISNNTIKVLSTDGVKTYYSQSGIRSISFNNATLFLSKDKFKFTLEGIESITVTPNTLSVD